MIVPRAGDDRGMIEMVLRIDAQVEANLAANVATQMADEGLAAQLGEVVHDPCPCGGEVAQGSFYHRNAARRLLAKRGEQRPNRPARCSPANCCPSLKVFH